MKEPSFRESVDIMYNRAVDLIELPPGLKEKLGFATQPTRPDSESGSGVRYILS